MSLGVPAPGASAWTAKAATPASTCSPQDHAVPIIQVGPAIAADPFLPKVLVDGLPEANIIAGLVTELTGYHEHEYGLDDNKLARGSNFRKNILRFIFHWA